MGFNSALISKFTPYLNKTGDDARATLRLEPLELTADELAEINQITLRSKIETLIASSLNIKMLMILTGLFLYLLIG